jgi:dolichol-phosphate mannosyltransferase
VEEGLVTTPLTQVIIAALNEEEGIGLTISEMQQYLGKTNVLVVDGNSTDRTVEVAKNLGAHIVFQDNFGQGKGDAIARALEHLDLFAKYVVVTDADYTYPAQPVPHMIRFLEEHPDVGMVCGNRFNGSVNPKALRKIFHMGNRMISWCAKKLNGIELEDPLTGLRVIRADILRNWKVRSKGFDIEVELNSHVKRCGFGVVEFPIQYRPRLGEKKLKARHGATVLKRIILETLH